VFTIADLIGDELHELESHAQQQYRRVMDVPLPVTEVLAGQAVDEE
jgi:hypothetical protein